MKPFCQIWKSSNVVKLFAEEEGRRWREKKSMLPDKSSRNRQPNTRADSAASGKGWKGARSSDYISSRSVTGVTKDRRNDSWGINSTRPSFSPSVPSRGSNWLPLWRRANKIVPGTSFFLSSGIRRALSRTKLSDLFARDCFVMRREPRWLISLHLRCFAFEILPFIFLWYCLDSFLESFGKSLRKMFEIR